MSKFRYFRRAVILSAQIKSPMSIIISILGFAFAFLPMLISLRLRNFTNNVQVLFSAPGMRDTVIVSFLVLALLYITQTVFSLVQSYFASEDTARIKRYVKEEVLRLLSSVSYKYIENQGDFKEKVDFINTYAGEKTIGSVSLIFGWVAGIISFVSVILILSVVSPWIVVVLIITCIPAVILSNLQKDETYRQRTKWIKEGRLTIHYSDISRNIEPMKEIRFYGLYPYLKEKWRSLSSDYVAKKNQVTRKHLLYNSAADLLRNGVYLIVLIITASQIFKNPSLGLGSFMLVISAAAQLQSITTSLLINAVSILTDVKYMEDFFYLMETEKEDETIGVPFNDVTIEFENVNFSYPNTGYLALDNLSVNIKQGEKIAIVGANGSGKTTFVNLLCGLYAPDNGTAKVNGEKITDSLWKVRRSLSVIFQYFSKYQDTLRANITISDPVRSNFDEEILALAKRTGADEVIKNQTNALDEMIGIFSEEGNNLSGGQWQKVAITRALFRKNARVYILDEPTAALDPIAEANIYRNFTALTDDKTTILISHRLGVTSVVDRILVFDKGKIVEDGSHADLMKKCGIYAQMYKAQAKWYQ